MKFVLKTISTMILTLAPTTATIACDYTAGTPQTYNATFTKINKFVPNLINISMSIMDLQLYKQDVNGASKFPDEFYKQNGFIKIEISNETNFNQFLKIYELDKSYTEQQIKDKISTTSILNGTILFAKYKQYSNFYYLIGFSGKIN